MRVAKPVKMEEAHIDLVPMIDFVFQLITFFMMVIQLGNIATDERVSLPSADMAKPSEAPIEQSLLLNLNREGKVFYAGLTVPVEEMGPYLQKERMLAEAAMKQAKRPLDKGLWTTVMIRADRDTPYGKLQQLIALCQAANFTKFTLKAKPAG